MRLESIHQDVISFERFIGRCIRYALIALGLLLLGLFPGVLGFLLLAELTAVQAWLNALSMVSGLELPYPVADFHQSRRCICFSRFIACSSKPYSSLRSPRCLRRSFTACFIACIALKRPSGGIKKGSSRISGNWKQKR